jgi:macrolide transport system ATP-binding/permease protein
MVHAKETTRFRFWLWLIRLIGVIVPQRLRADWRQEWESELQHRELMLAQWDRLNSRSKLDLLRRSTSAFWDALRLQPRRWEDEMVQDVRYGIRMLLKRPGFTSIAVITLALGIGANLTIFSFVDTMFLRPLPVREPYQLVAIDGGFAYPVYAHFRDHNKSFEALATHYSTAPLDAAGASGDSVPVNGAVVSANYFSTLGITPSLGRFFLPEEDIVPDRDRVAVISHGFWQTRFGGDAAVVGKEIRLNGSVFTIVGVTPEGFEGVSPGYPNDLWIPTMMLRLGYRWCDALKVLTCGPLESIGRLNRNQTLAGAQTDLAVLSSQMAAANPGTRYRSVQAHPALGVRAMDRPALTYQFRLMMTMTGVLLLIACANVAGLLLTSAAARRREISVRLCIGAGRARLIRQFLTESLLLTLAGGAFGLLVSLWAKNVLLGYYAARSNFRMTYDLSLNPRTLLFALALTIVAGLLFGLVPAIESSRPDLVRSLKDESGSQSRRRNWGRDGLVVAQVALSLALLVSAGLMVRSVAHIHQGENFDPQQVVSLRLRPRLRDYPPEKAQAFTKEVLRRLEATPGVQSVSLSKTTLAWRGSGDVRVRLPEQTFNRPEDQLLVHVHEIAPRLLETLKLPLIQGSDFNDSDRQSAPRVVIVNETLAKRMWPDGVALERILVVNEQQHRVVGVTKDAQFRNAAEAPKPFLYLPYWQNTLSPQIDSTIMARVAGDPVTMPSILRREISKVDANVPIESATMTQQVNDVFQSVLLSNAVLISSSAIALLLSMIGLYGTVAFAVRQRTREIGVRMALGAQATDVLKLIVGQGLRLVFVGLMVGLLAAFAATRLMNSLLYGVSPTDPITFILVASLLTLVAFGACWIPARRATQVDPLTALRHE